MVPQYGPREIMVSLNVQIIFAFSFCFLGRETLAQNFTTIVFVSDRKDWTI